MSCKVFFDLYFDRYSEERSGKQGKTCGRRPRVRLEPGLAALSSVACGRHMGWGGVGWGVYTWSANLQAVQVKN